MYQPGHATRRSIIREILTAAWILTHDFFMKKIRHIFRNRITETINLPDAPFNLFGSMQLSEDKEWPHYANGSGFTFNLFLPYEKLGYPIYDTAEKRIALYYEMVEQGQTELLPAGW